jgi:hypothetical protein
VLQFIKTETPQQIIEGILHTDKAHDIQSYESNVNLHMMEWLNQFIMTYGYLNVNIVIQDWFDSNSQLVELAKKYDYLPPALHVNPALPIQALKAHFGV